MFTLSEELRATYPGAHIGLLAMHGVSNPDSCQALDERKQALETRLRGRYAEQGRAAIRMHPTIRAYAAYYKQFRKTYHVQLQLESVALKNRDIPRTAALVEAMFMAELEQYLLTAAHDWDSVKGPVRADVATGDETYERLTGGVQTLKAGDMYIADSAAIMSSIIYGPDKRTRVRPQTTSVLFTTYVPTGIPRSTLEAHLVTIEENVRMIAPGAETFNKSIYTAQKETL
jgi:DNA/RNA-binding domain of Phe-tRNA-synthetase-like protein